LIHRTPGAAGLLVFVDPNPIAHVNITAAEMKKAANRASLYFPA
jgi:hypothetical protein